MRIRMNYYTDPDILHTDPNSDSGKKLKILILSTIFKYKRKFKKCSKVKIKGLILTFCYGLFLHIYHILYRGYYTSWIRICISLYGSDFYYTNPDPWIRIRITAALTDPPSHFTGSGCTQKTSIWALDPNNR